MVKSSSSNSSAIGLLKNIAISLNNIFLYLTGQVSSPSFRGNIDGWDYEHVGKSWFYTRTVTYTGSASTIDLSFPHSVQLNRIEHIWNDTTTKDFSVRVISEPSSAAYIELDTQTGNTSTSRILQLGSEFKYPSGSRLRIYSGTNTNTKTDTIKLQVDEL